MKKLLTYITQIKCLRTLTNLFVFNIYLIFKYCIRVDTVNCCVIQNLTKFFPSIKGTLKLVV